MRWAFDDNANGSRFLDRTMVGVVGFSFWSLCLKQNDLLASGNHKIVSQITEIAMMFFHLFPRSSFIAKGMQNKDSNIGGRFG